MSRLDSERERELGPKRKQYALTELGKLQTISDIQSGNDDCVTFEYRGHRITFWAYSGWFTGKGVVAGRGINNLLQQLK